MFDFGPLTIRTLQKRKLFTRKFFKRFSEITWASLQHLQLNFASCNVMVDSLKLINFQENYQTAEIYFYSYVTPLNMTISNYYVS